MSQRSEDFVTYHVPASSRGLQDGRDLAVPSGQLPVGCRKGSLHICQQGKRPHCKNNINVYLINAGDAIGMGSAHHSSVAFFTRKVASNANALQYMKDLCNTTLTKGQNVVDMNHKAIDAEEVLYLHLPTE